MSTFLDGPAARVSLSLRRAPIFLRVVIDAQGKVDALDQLDDQPAPGESVHVYVLTGLPSNVHICARGPNRIAGGWFQMGQYRLHSEQPGPEITRDTAAWRAWCQAPDLALPDWLKVRRAMTPAPQEPQP